MQIRLLGFLIVALLLVLGVIGLFVPQRLFAMAEFTTSPTGLIVAAAVRLAIGAILLTIASRSRVPTILRVFGVLALLGGIATLFLGSDRAQAILRWVGTYGTTFPRLFGIFAVVISCFIAYAISNRKLQGNVSRRTA